MTDKALTGKHRQLDTHDELSDEIQQVKMRTSVYLYGLARHTCTRMHAHAHASHTHTQIQNQLTQTQRLTKRISENNFASSQLESCTPTREDEEVGSNASLFPQPPSPTPQCMPAGPPTYHFT